MTQFFSGGACLTTMHLCCKSEVQEVYWIQENMDTSADFLGEPQATADPMKPDPVVRYPR